MVSLTQRRLNAVIWLDSPPLQWLRHALASFEQRNRFRAHGLAPAYRLEPFAGFRFYTYLLWVDPYSLGDVLLHSTDMRRKLRLLNVDRRIDVDDTVALLIEQRADVAQK